VDIAVNRQELAMPPSLKLDQIVDFNLYMIKAILNGRGDEIVDLARTRACSHYGQSVLMFMDGDHGSAV
jgi:molybdopterin biosynthesis enzyme